MLREPAMRILSLLLILSVAFAQAPAMADWFDNARSYLNRAKQQYRSGQFSEALKSLQEVIALSPDSAEGYYWRAITFHSLGQHDRALEDLNEAIRLAPNESAFYLNRGLIYLNRKEFNVAVADFDQVLKLDPSRTEAIANRNFALREIDKEKKAALQKITKDNEEAERLSQENKIRADEPAKQNNNQAGIEVARLAEQKEKERLRLEEKRRLSKLALKKEKSERKAVDEAKAERLAIKKAEKERLAKGTPAETKIDSALKQASLESAEHDINRPVKDKWALVIGISEFQDKSLNMQYPAKDAADFCNYLVREGHFAKDHVKLVVNEQATRSRILSELGDKWLPRVANPDDLVMIYISSHGSPSDLDVGGVNYLLAYDSDVNSLYATGLPMQDLARIIKGRVHSDRVVLVLDACHSGAADPGSKGLSRHQNVDVDELVQGTGQLVISSSQPSQVSWESMVDKNSVFTKYLIEGLKKNGDRTTLDQAFKHMKERVQEHVLRERGVLQSPVLKSKWEGRDLILAAPPVAPRVGLQDTTNTPVKAKAK